LELKELLAALRAGWIFPIVGSLLGGLVALAFSLWQTPLYTSTTELFVSTTQAGTAADAFVSSQFSQSRVTSYARLVSGTEVAARVVDRLNLDMSPDELRRKVTATPVTDTVLIDVSVTDVSAERAQRIAVAVGEEFSGLVNQLETPQGSGPSPVRVTVTEPPVKAVSPSSPQTPQNTGLGLLVGAVLGGGLALIRARLDRSVKDLDDIQALTGAPVIGAVFQSERLDTHHTIDLAHDVRAIEDYRLLTTHLQFLDIEEPVKVIMVSSALPSEGRTTAVVNLGMVLAEAGCKVTIVDADLRRPMVAEFLGLAEGAGLTDVLRGEADVSDVVRYRANDLRVITSGSARPGLSPQLISSSVRSVLDKLRAENDFVLVDAPPLLPVADATGLSVLMDGVVLSVRYGSTHWDQLRQAGASLERVGARTLGVVLNIVPPNAQLATAFGHGRRYSGPSLPPFVKASKGRRGAHSERLGQRVV